MKQIIIAAVPRSGSSLIASIFAKHGVYVGEFSKKIMSNTPIPYDSFENDELSQCLKGNCNISDVTRIMPMGKTWLYKGDPIKSLKLYGMLKEYNPIQIKVHRELKNIKKSSAPHKARMREAQYYQLLKMPGHVVDSDEIMAGDFSLISEALKLCGILPDEEIIKNAINVKLWHHKKGL